MTVSAKMRREPQTATHAAATLAGVIGAAALVWYVGPLVAVAGVAPLAGEPARWAAIAALAVSSVLVVVGWRWRESRRNRRLMEGLLADREASPGDKEVAVITQRFEKAVQLLRRQRMGGRHPWVAALRGLPYAYQLPWYLIMGAPGAGKTTALINSGLQFPLAGNVGREVVRGVGGTRHCDWWFTDRAVLIDTAGRYTTQGSDRSADRTAWIGFLDLLARHRPRRPLNGVLLTISASELLGATPERRLAHAAELRDRIEELRAHFDLAIPVYVIVTKTDLLAGFMEFFADFDKDERAQVWGMTFAHEPQRSDADDDAAARMANEFALLEKRLNDCMIERLHGERDRERRSALHAFPQEWRLLRQTLSDFLQAMVEGMRPELRSMVRGVYFTSATQEGTPMDRALGAMARALGLAHRVLAPSRPSGRTFFMTKLLRDVVFAEADLAGTNLRWRRRRDLVERGVIGAIAVAVLGAAALSWRGYAASQERLQAVSGELPTLTRLAGAARRDDAVDIVAMLPLLDALAGLRSRGDTAVRALPVVLQMGMDRSEILDGTARDAYHRALREGLLPRIAARMEQRLRAGSREHVELSYETLRTYLMLFGGRHFDAAALRAALRADWDATLPAQVTPAQREALALHLDRLLATGEVGAPSQADAALVQATRALVGGVPLAQRVYRRLLQMDPVAEPVPFSLVTAGGSAAPRLFARASGQALARGVPAIYTRAAAGPWLRDRSLEVLGQLAREEDWVLGRRTAALSDAASRERLVEEVQQLHRRDYAAQWGAFIADLRLAPTADLAATADQARNLGHADLALAGVLRSLVREVSVEGLAAPPVGASGTSSGDFQALQQYVSAGPGPWSELQSLLGRAAVHLAAVEDSARRQALPPTGGGVLRELDAAARRAPEPVRGLLTALVAKASAQSVQRLREPISRALAETVAPACMRTTSGRFPFSREASADMSREDFARLFAAGGVLDGFFQSQLAPYVDTSARPWALAGSAGGDDALQAFQRAQSVRDGFFSDGGKRLGTRLEFTLVEMDAGLNEFSLEIDGQPMRFRGGGRSPTQAVQWPGPELAGQVRLQVQPSSNPPYVFNGPWALYRLLDRVRVERGATPDRALLVFDVEGRKARFEVRSAAGVNPLSRQELEQFRCPQRL